MRIWAIQIKYLSEKDNKWHRHTTKWYENASDAWAEKDAYELQHGKDWLESSASLIHKKL